MDTLLKRIDAGELSPLYLVTGDRVLSEPTAVRLAEALAAKVGCEPEVHKRPAGLEDIFADLDTYSLFATGKVVAAVETAVLADLGGAAGLIDEAIEVLPISAEEGDLAANERRSALRLLQALRLFELDPYAGDAEQLLAQLPDWALQGAPKKGRRKRSKPQVKKLREGLAPLLERARSEGLKGRAENAASELAEILQRGLPEGHHLVLAESSVAKEHPVLQALEERKAVVRLGGIETDRGNFSGLRAVTEELERQTGVGIDRRAVEELARRTLRRAGGGGGWGSEAVDAESTGRFASEYRKLAGLAASGKITADLVEDTVADRGDEDVWKILDAIGTGNSQDALTRVERLFASSDDVIGTRLSLFGLIAGFCRQLAALGGLLRSRRVPRGERNYQRFKSSLAPKLQAPLPDGRKNPLEGLHPFRLHRAYMAASALTDDQLAALPARVLETELQMKGDSRSPEVALTALVASLATAVSARPN